MDISISREPDPFGTRRSIYHLSSEQGAIEATFHPEWQSYMIANFDVHPDYRGQGIGKLLLRASLEHAQELGARHIIAGIISRECLDAMRRVFGDESISVAHVGEYCPKGQLEVAHEHRTDAYLYHHLQQTDK